MLLNSISRPRLSDFNEARYPLGIDMILTAGCVGGSAAKHAPRGSGGLASCMLRSRRREAIDNAHRWLAEIRRGDTSVDEIGLDQITEQLSLTVARIMAEGSLYDPSLRPLR